MDKNRRSVKIIVQAGRVRIMLRLGQRFRFGLERQGPGAWSGGFGFGMFTFLRRIRGTERRRPSLKLERVA